MEAKKVYCVYSVGNLTNPVVGVYTNWQDAYDLVEELKYNRGGYYEVQMVPFDKTPGGKDHVQY